MSSIFLIGGGWRAETFAQTYGRFLQAAAKNGKRKIAIVVAEEPGADSQEQFLRFFKAFESIGLSRNEAANLIVAAENPLTEKKLAEIEPTGIFVCGGLTPAYYDALCVDKSWLALLTENEIPYCGFSAGAAIAAENAIIGGWQRKFDNRTVEITDENAGEDLDFLDVRGSLGLVPFAVDVHATQWGTLSRLVHTIDAGLADEGFAIDENTVLHFDGKNISVYGIGGVYHVQRRAEKIFIEILQAEIS